MMNIHRQLRLSIKNVNSGIAMKLPSDDADWQRPVANPRSLIPNQSRTTRAPPGNKGASPSPSANRAATNDPKFVTKPPAACATDQLNSPSPSIRRGPNRSINPPTGSWANA